MRRVAPARSRQHTTKKEKKMPSSPPGQTTRHDHKRHERSRLAEGSGSIRENLFGLSLTRERTAMIGITACAKTGVTERTSDARLWVAHWNTLKTLEGHLRKSRMTLSWPNTEPLSTRTLHVDTYLPSTTAETSPVSPSSAAPETVCLTPRNSTTYAPTSERESMPTFKPSPVVPPWVSPVDSPVSSPRFLHSLMSATGDPLGGSNVKCSLRTPTARHGPLRADHGL